jgi:hypothetical protein
VIKPILAVCLGASLLACTPTLNWREVTLERMTTLLPCKPDTAQRQLTINGQVVAMKMAGCEAGGALYAISHTRSTVDAAAGLQGAWAEATLANLQARAQAGQTLTGVKGDVGKTVRMEASGRRPDGAEVQARLAWIISGGDVFHLAVYADQLPPDANDTFFSDIKIQ